MHRAPVRGAVLVTSSYLNMSCSAAAGRCTRRHCTMLSLMAPAFMLLVAGAAQLGALAFLALYIAAAGALYAVMYASFLQCRRAGVDFKPRHAVSR